MTPAQRANALAAELHLASHLEEWVYDKLVDRLRAEFEAAGRDERERAAKVADNFAAGADAVTFAEGQPWCPACGSYVRNVADDIAAAIREGGAE